MILGWIRKNAQKYAPLRKPSYSYLDIVKWRSESEEYARLIKILGPDNIYSLLKGNAWVAPKEPTKKMLAACAAAMSPTKRPTKSRVSVKQKHRIRYIAMMKAHIEDMEKKDG